MIVLVLNCGSSSVKYQVIETVKEERLIHGLVERIGAVTAIASHSVSGKKAIKKTIQIQDHTQALKEILDFLASSENSVMKDINEIVAVGHRVVHGGETFKDSVLINDDVIEAIEAAVDLAPLHNPPNLSGIRAAMSILPNVPHVAVFDTAFHHSLPAHAYLYAIPNRLYRRYKIRRYGFHGPSHYYVSRRFFRLNNINSMAGTRLITCHLGNGGSITAIQDGKSVDTSMGFTPLEGLVMGTRSGDIDPSILFFLVEKEELSLSNLHALLNRHSGLLGLSGFAADMRDLLEEAAKGDRRCEQAIETYCYRAKKYIGSYMAAMNGADAIIFTGGIGENAAEIRKRILSGMENLGVLLNESRNQLGNDAGERRISDDHSRIQVWVIPTNEELVIAKDAAKIATAAKNSPWI